MARRFALLTSLALLAVTTIGADESAAQAQPTFRGGVDVVALDVCVKDRDGRFVPGLTAGDFLVLDNNAPRAIEFFSAGSQVPLAVVLLIDRSSSMSGLKMDRAKMAASAFIGMLGPDDVLEIIAFADRTERPLSFSTDRAAAEQAIAGLSAKGMTVLFESLSIALRDLAEMRRRETTQYRQAIVILSDGEDTKSLLAFDDVLEEARQSGVLIYTVSLRSDANGRALPTPRELFQLANDTGGRAIAIEDPEKLAPVYEEIGAELRHLYRLAFLPTGTANDGSWRRLAVRVPVQAAARVRTRAGYYAPRPPLRLAEGQ
jgi:Ca-activated chloride channel family protein